MLVIQSFYKRSRAGNRSTQSVIRNSFCAFPAVKQDALGAAFRRSPD
jgi:hypothetical protein